MALPQQLSVPVPWGHIAAKEWGCPGMPRVLAVHGLHDNAAAFDQLTSLLAHTSQLSVVCVDLPGHGLSSPLPPGLLPDLLDYVCALKRVTYHLKWDRFTLLAHSFGGHICTYFAAIYGQSVCRLVLIDVFFAHPILDDNFILERCQMLFDKLFHTEKIKRRFYTYEECLTKLSEDRVTELGRIQTEKVKALQERAFKKHEKGYVHSNDLRLNLLSQPLITLNFHFGLIKGVACPLLLISTSEFEPFLSVPVTKRTIDQLQQQLGRRMKVTSVQGSHDIHMEQPHVIAPIIIQFITTQDCHL